MQTLLSTLYHIEKECNDGKEGVRGQNEKGVDEFARSKASCARNLASAREQIKERDEVMKKGNKATDRYIIELSARIRATIREAKEDAGRMRDLHTKAAQKAKKGKEEENKHRSEVVDLVMAHIAEVESLEKRRQGEENSEARSSLFSGAKPGKKKGGGGGGGFGGGGGGGGGGSSSQWGPVSGSAAADPTQTDLPEINVDEGMAQIRKNDMDMDQDLAEISQGVATLNQIAIGMQEELKVQEAMIGDIETKVDDASRHLNSTNRRLKKTLDSVGGAEKAVVWIILIIVILGIGYFIYSQAS